MRALVVRQRLTRSAAVAASVLLLAACGTKTNGGGGGGGTDALGSVAGLSAGMLLLSNGTTAVVVGGRTFTFPTTVTDAVYSPDGSRIAFINADGNVATARIDGSGLVVLTKKADGVVRTRPAWIDAQILFGEQTGNKAPVMRMVSVNGTGPAEADADLGNREDDTEDFSSGWQPSGPITRSTTVRSHTLAFQRKGAKGDEVWVADLHQRSPDQYKVADGTSPALAPDGVHVAYVGTNGQVEVAGPKGDELASVQVTFGVASPSHLTWTPDGKQVAFVTATDVEAVAGIVPSGTTSNPTTQLSATVGVPGFLPPSKDRVARFVGTDPVEASIAASQARWPTLKEAQESQSATPASAAVLAGTGNLPVMLAGAQMVDLGPLLFTGGGSLDPRTATELTRALGHVVKDGFVPTVTILGGTDSISTQTENAVKALGYKTERVPGKDPYAIAVTAAGKPAGAKDVFLVDAADTAGYASAISDLGAYSSQTVLLTNGSTMPDPVKTFLNGLPKTAKLYGVDSAAMAAMGASWPGKPSLAITAISGKTPTAGLLANYAGGVTDVVVVDASSTSDVIAGIGLARGYSAPVLVVDGKAGLDDNLRSWLDSMSGSIDNVMIVDSKSAVSADLEKAIEAAVAGPLGGGKVSNPKAAAWE